MKKLSPVIILLFIILIYGCSDEPNLVEPYNGSLQSESNILSKINSILVTPPTGIPETDWSNIQLAFDNISDGGTIQLQKGIYRIHKPIICEGFKGTFKGVKRDQTVIEAVRATDGSGFEMMTVLPMEKDFPVMINFRKVNDLTMTDMSLKVIDDVCDLYLNAFYGPTNSLHICILVQPDKAVVNTLFKNLNISGNQSSHSDSFLDKNVITALLFGGGYGPTGGEHLVKNCIFSKCGWSALETDGMVNSKVIIGGEKRGKNLFEDVTESILFYSSKNCQLEFTNNEVNIYKGYYRGLGAIFNSNCNLTIFDNKFSISGGYNAIFFRNNSISTEFRIRHNKFLLTNVEWGIQIREGYDSEIRENKFEGNCNSEIIICGNRNEVKNLKIIGNKLEDIYTDLPKIYLGEYSLFCYVTDNGDISNVLDEGTNNIIQ